MAKKLEQALTKSRKPGAIGVEASGVLEPLIEGLRGYVHR